MSNVRLFGLLCVPFCLALATSQAPAMSVGFANGVDGSFTITDSGGTAGFSETLSFAPTVFGPGELSGWQIELTDLALKEVPGSPLGGSVYTFVFESSMNAAGIKLSSGGAEIVGDLTVATITTFNSNGGFGSVASANITNLVASGYAAGSSEFIDKLLSTGNGGLSVTFNTGNGSIQDIIETGERGIGTYSGNLAIVPVPASHAMLGMAALSLVIGNFARHRFRKSY